MAAAIGEAPPTVGDALLDLMAENGWPYAEQLGASRQSHCTDARRRLEEARRS